jgi:hypothetical protein
MRYGEATDPVAGVADAMAQQQLALNKSPGGDQNPLLLYAGSPKGDPLPPSPGVGFDQLQRVLRELGILRTFQPIDPNWKLFGTTR